MQEKVKISAVICTHNRAKFLEKCIRSVYHQTLARDLFEVIVVDNASSDETEAVCQPYKDDPGFSYIKDPTPGLSHARNTGWQAAKSDYVGYLDDDAVACPEWIETALWCFESIDPAPVWVGGAIFLEWEADPPSWICEDYETALGKVYWGDNPKFLSERGERLGGGNSFYKREVLEKLKGFDVQLGRKKNRLLSAEETQLQHKITSQGGRLYYHPKICIKHFVPVERTNPKWLYRRYYWGGRSDVLMEKSLSSIRYEKLVAEFPQDSLLMRLTKNVLKSLGLTCSRDDTIRGRIYMAYVVGRSQGLLMHFLKVPFNAKL